MPLPIYTYSTNMVMISVYLVYESPAIIKLRPEHIYHTLFSVNGALQLSIRNCLRVNAQFYGAQLHLQARSIHLSSV